MLHRAAKSGQKYGTLNGSVYGPLGRKRRKKGREKNRETFAGRKFFLLEHIYRIACYGLPAYLKRAGKNKIENSAAEIRTYIPTCTCTYKRVKEGDEFLETRISFIFFRMGE